MGLDERKPLRVHYVAEPTPAKFHGSNARVRALMGPFGSGKSSACCWEIIRRAHEQKPGPSGIRRSRWVIIRNTFPQLRDTTLKTWNDWFGDMPGRWYERDQTWQIRPAEGVEAEIMFRALDRPDHVRNLASLEVTGAWINEAREVPWVILEALDGRIGRYPAKRYGGASWKGIILDTNPCDTDHWWFKKFEIERPKGWEIYRQPSGLSPDAENLQNLPSGYYRDLAVGKDSQWVKVYIHGDYGYVQDGRPVHPDYREDVNVSDEDLEPIPRVPLIVGMDFGLTPAAVIGQVTPRGQVRILEELVTESMGAERFGAELLRLIRRRFKRVDLIERWTGDPSGDSRAQTDEKTVFDILRALGIPAQRAYTNDLGDRIDAVNQAIATMVGGEPGLLLSPRCHVLRRALGGGYRYRRMLVSGHDRYEDKPDKNNGNEFSHVAEALQYMLLGAGRGSRDVRRRHRGVSKPGKARFEFDVYA